MSLPKLTQSARMGDQVFEAMHAAIMSGDLPAGHHLRIRELADELGTSVMPVREAIRRLEEIGLAEALPYKGAIVKNLTPEELLHIYAVRRLLEVEATSLGVAKALTGSVSEMEAELGAMEVALTEHRVVEYLNRDEQLLSIIYSAGGNPVLLETIRMLWQRCRSYKIVGVERELESQEFDALLAFQERLLAAVQAGDAQQAAAITAESLDAAIQRIREALPEPVLGSGRASV